MWEEGVRIYGTPGVPNNFPLNIAYIKYFLNEKKKKVKENMKSIYLNGNLD